MIMNTSRRVDNLSKVESKQEICCLVGNGGSRVETTPVYVGEVKISGHGNPTTGSMPEHV